MADSDSEDFESADEEVEEKKHHKKPVINPQVKEKVQDEKHAPQAKKEVPEPKPVPEKQQEPAKVEKPLEKPEEVKTSVKEEPSSWRSWGAFSVISNASKTVASITTQVSQSIIDLGQSINIPDPEEMAKMQAEEKKRKLAETPSEGSAVNEDKTSDDSRFNLDNLLSGVTQISSKVVAGGLDTLEGIGKKTINILQESDPNIKSKIRNMSSVNSKPNLSDLLKEAKDREEVSPSGNESVLKTVSFEHLLDEYKGLVFLEALEILSNQSKMKIELLMKPLSGKVLTEMEETLDEVKELCEFDSENVDETLTAENFTQKLQAAMEDLNVKLNIQEIVNHSTETQKWLDGIESSLQSSDIYEKSIHVMAKSCALSLNNFQKLAELLLSQDRRSTADEADSLSQLATIYCSLLNYFATKFIEKLTSNDSETKKMSTNLFLESSNAITHIKTAFNLFIPILQIGAI